MDHITICKQKGVACFVDPTENHLWAAVHHRVCHVTVVYSLFLVPPSGQKNTVTASFPLNMHFKKNTAVELVNLVSLYLLNAEEKWQ